jgi:hypothetical protein
MVFNATFNNISVISWRSVLLMGKLHYQEKTTDLPQVTDKLDHIMFIKFTPVNRVRLFFLFMSGALACSSSGEEIINVSANQRPRQDSWISNCFKYFLWTSSRGTFLTNLMNLHIVVLDNKLKTLQPIRGQGNHLWFQIPTKSENTSWGEHF